MVKTKLLLKTVEKGRYSSYSNKTKTDPLYYRKLEIIAKLAEQVGKNYDIFFREYYPV